MIKISNAKDNIHGLKDIKTRETIEAKYIGPSDNPKTFNYKRLSQIYKSAAVIDSKIASEVRGINNGIKSIIDKNQVEKDKKEYKEEEDPKSREGVESVK